MSQGDALPPDELDRLQQFARLRLEERDVAILRNDIAAILRMVDQMRDVDTDGVEPLTHPLELHQRLRDDHSQSLDPGQAEAERRQNTSALRQGFYLVPRVVS